MLLLESSRRLRMMPSSGCRGDKCDGFTEKRTADNVFNLTIINQHKTREYFKTGCNSDVNDFKFSTLYVPLLLHT